MTIFPVFSLFQQTGGNVVRCGALVSHDVAAVVAILAATLQTRLGVVPFQIRQLLSVDRAAPLPA